jgi:hypothetical protein
VFCERASYSCHVPKRSLRTGLTLSVARIACQRPAAAGNERSADRTEPRGTHEPTRDTVEAMTSQRGWVVLLLAFAPCALDCGSNAAGSCRTYCDSLCNQLDQCAARPSSCVDTCATGMGTDNCEGAPAPSRLTCADASKTYACAEYCAAVCARAAPCGGFDPQACGVGCAAIPKRTCNAASVGARTCDQLKPELGVYESMAHHLIQSPSSWTLLVMQTGVCSTPGDCQLPLGCSAKTNTCGLCTTDAECASPNDYSFSRHACLANGQCTKVDCAVDGDCYQGWCDPNGHVCRDCRTDTECTNSTMRPACNPTTFVCVECLTDAHCTKAWGGIYPACNTQTNKCIECNTDAHCATAMGGYYPACNTQTNKCVECKTDAQCAAKSSFAKTCNVQTFGCVQCMTDAQCTSTYAPRCNATNNLCTY